MFSYRTDDKSRRLLQVADKPYIYKGNVSLDSNNQSNVQIAAEARKIMKKVQFHREKAAIDEMKEASKHGKAITDLHEIYKAVNEGRSDLLIAYSEYRQAVKMTGEYTFDLLYDASQPEVIDDISNEMAWKAISKKGLVVFTDQLEIKDLGDIVLKVRY